MSHGREGLKRDQNVLFKLRWPVISYGMSSLDLLIFVVCYSHDYMDESFYLILMAFWVSFVFMPNLFLPPPPMLAQFHFYILFATLAVWNPALLVIYLSLVFLCHYCCYCLSSYIIKPLLPSTQKWRIEFLESLVILRHGSDFFYPCLFLCCLSLLLNFNYFLHSGTIKSFVK